MNYNRFVQLCAEKDITPSGLMTKLGLNRSNTTTWKNGGNPSVEILLKLCDELNCSMDYLYDRSDERNSTVPDTDISSIFQSLDKTGKTIVMAKAIEELRRLETL